MAATKTIQGFYGKITLSDLTGQGIEFNTSSWTIDWTADTLDDTDFSTTGPRTFKGGLTSWTGSFEAWIDKDTALFSSGIATAPTEGQADFAFSDATDHVRFRGEIIITGLGLTTAVDGLPKLSASFQGSGTLAQSIVA